MKTNKRLYGWLTLMVVFVFLLPHGLFCYPALKCPAREQWTLRAQNCSNQDGYICLLDINTGLYRETCISDKQKEITPGHKRVFAGNLHGIPCNDDRYQPFTFWTNGNSDCTYEKSICNGEGQVLFQSGYHTTDSQCRCDYNYGYDFVNTPKNRCYCVPSEEDCSCYQKTCNSGYLLTQDYECKDVNNWPIRFNCPIVPYISNTFPSPVETPIKIPDETNETKDFNILKIIPVIAVILFTIFLIVFMVVCSAFEEKSGGRTQFVYIPLPPDPVEMPQNIKDLQDQETNKWKQEIEKFVPTSASRYAKKVLGENQIIVITGPVGCGKSVTARHLVLDLIENEGYQLLIVYSSDDIFRYAKMDRKQIIFIDDIFGKYTISDFENAWWQKQHERIMALFSRNDNIKVIATCRSDIFLEMNHQVRLSFRELSFLSPKTCLSTEERRKIGKMYFEDALDKLGDELIERYDFFPAICGSNRFSNVSDELDCPVNFLQFEINKLHEYKSIKLFTMALVVLYNNSFNEENVDIYYSKDMDMLMSLSRDLDIILPSKVDITNSLTALIGSYFQKEKSTYSFTCKRLFSIIMYLTSKFILGTILNFGKNLLLTDQVMLESLNCKPPKLTILISKQYEEDYFERLFKDLKSGVFLHIFMDMQNRFEAFRSTFIKYLQGKKLKSTDLKNAPDQTTVIHAIALAGYMDYLVYFLNLDRSRINHINFKKKNPLHFAAQMGHTEVVKYLTENNAFVNATDNDKKTPLDLACKHGHIETIEFLVLSNVGVKPTQTTLISALTIACENGNLDIVKLLIDAKANVNGTDMQLRVPLCLAARNAHNKVMEHLLSNGANVDSIDAKGRTAIFYATRVNNLEGVRLLRTKNANPNIDTEDGENCFHVASEKGYYDIVILLLDIKNKMLDKKIKKSGNTPLYLACMNGHKDVVRILLQNNADVNIVNNSKSTPLHVASREGYSKIVDVLIHYHANVNCCMLNNETPLHLACERGQYEVVKLLIKKRAKINVVDESHQTPLHKAAFHGFGNIVQILCEQNVDIDEQDDFGRTALFISCENGHSKTASILVNNNADLDKMDNSLISPFSIACRAGHLDVLNILIQAKSNIGLCDRDLLSPLHISCIANKLEAVELLLKNGSDVEQKDQNGNTPLHIAASHDNLEIMRTLLEHKAIIESKNELGETPLFVAVAKKSIKCIRLLVQKGADINSVNNLNNSILSKVTESDILSILENQYQNDTNID